GLTIAGTGIAVAPLAPAALSAPMGDAAPAALDAGALDSYDRPYRINLTPDFVRPAMRRSLASAVDATQRHIGLGTETLGLTLNLARAPETMAQSDPHASR